MSDTWKQILLVCLPPLLTGIFLIAQTLLTKKNNKKSNQEIQEQIQKHNEASRQQFNEYSELTIYRLEQLEKKQDKHNTLIERMYAVEDRLNVHDEKIAVANHRISDLEKEVGQVADY